MSYALKNRSLAELLEEYRDSKRPLEGPGAARRLSFEGVGGCDVYNVTAPFSWDSGTYLLGRVEPRDTEHSCLFLFEYEEPKSRWIPSTRISPMESLQDPCFTFIDGDLVFGGVRFPVPLTSGELGWRTEFHRLNRQGEVTPLFLGPEKMKDIRLKQLRDGRIAVFTRPQGAIGGRGRIGFTIVDSLADVNAEIMEAAPLFPDQHPDEEWSGANEIHLLQGGLLGVLGHVARFDGPYKRQYFSMVFAVDPETRETGPMRIIAERKDFPAGPAKRPDLEDVIFSGGLVRGPDGRATLYAGLSDAAAASLEIPDPFLEWE